ncbi:MAG: phage portal protein family protein, partial [Chloroflexota bacterium]
LAEHIIWEPLVHADWDIECADEDKRQFMKAVVDRIYLKLMLYSLPAISLGFAAFTKQWGQGIPYDSVGNPLWPQGMIERDIYPVVPVDLKQLDPLTVRPLVENDEFKGLHQDGWGDIDPLYAMWITHHRHKVWGNLWGWPLLTNVYSWWWSSGFRQGLLNRHIEDRVSPPLVVDYPPGEAEDPQTGDKVYNRQAALDSGRAIRSGETVAMPSDWYFDDNGRPFGRKWDARFLQGGENAQAFVELEDASDLRILMGMLIPPQALLQAKGGIGSQSVAETLGEVFWVSQRIRKQEIDQQFTDYVVEPIERLNWPQGPPCKLVTTRFRREDQAMIGELLKIVANRQDMRVDRMLDLQSMLRRAGVPEGGGLNDLAKETNE